MGLEQLKKLDYLHQARKENFDKLMKIFEPYQDFFYLPKAMEKSDPSWFGFRF
jgi:CDP-6-deoxy-D-xylo-4-hexulose-3-dehydrase